MYNKHSNSFQCFNKISSSVLQHSSRLYRLITKTSIENTHYFVISLKLLNSMTLNRLHSMKLNQTLHDDDVTDMALLTSHM